MQLIKRSLNGSTLAEMLVMMIVAGIIFLSIMDALTVFTRMQLQRAEAIVSAGKATIGYFRTESLIASSDSISVYGDIMELHRDGHGSALHLRDSSLTYVNASFRDTLLTGVNAIRIAQNQACLDTIEIILSAGYTLRFPVPTPKRKQYIISLDQIENRYGYEE